MNVNVYISHNEQIQIHVNVRAHFRYCVEMNINVQYNHRKGKSPGGIHNRINQNMKGENTMKHEKLITYYEQRLEKVKAAWNEDAAVDDYQRERCRAYVDAAQADLEAVKNGREW